MNELEVKKVPFLGTELMAARDQDGQIWAGVRWMCNGIGLSDKQRDNQIEKIKADTVLSKGAGNFRLPTNGGNQSVLCLKLDYVPLWLAKINVTPTIQAENPELADRLVEYQLKAKDVLAEAFLGKGQALTPPQDYLSALKALVAEVEQRQALEAENAIMKPKADYFDDLVDRNTLTNFRDTAKELGWKPKKFVQNLLEEKYIYRDASGDLKPYAAFVEKGLFTIKECKSKKTDWSGTQTLITPKGRETFRLLLNGAEDTP